MSLAFNERVSLSAQGFYAPTDLDQLSKETPEGRPFYYFNYAAAVSEVEVDVLTGETTIIRSDIVYDAGHSLNPAIDIGQVRILYINNNCISHNTKEAIIIITFL